MEIIYENSGTTLIAELFGEMDHHASEKVRRDIDEMMEQYETRNLIFDFSRVTFMDSAGIGVIIGRYKKLKPKDGMIFVSGCSQKIQYILNMAGIFSIVEYADTKKEAIELLQKGEVS